MSLKIDEITSKIKKLEEELLFELRKNQKEFFYKIENEKIKFEERIVKEGRSKIIGSIKYLSSFPVSVILTIPFIWAMIIPIIITDIFVTIFQTVCFPIYKIPKVRRKDYVVFDRYNLFYLDKVEKINCWYCEYFNGVVSYVKEIAGRTEQFWCPIKHATPPKEKHTRYDNFFEFGDYTNYRKDLHIRRFDFSDIEGEKNSKN